MLRDPTPPARRSGYVRVWPLLVVALSVSACAPLQYVFAEQPRDAAREVPATHPVPPPAPPHDDVATQLEAAAREHLGSRYGGFWIDGRVMFVAVAGGVTEDLEAALEPVAAGLPWRIVTVEVPLQQLEDVVAALPSDPVWDLLTSAAADVRRNAVLVGVTSRNDIERAEHWLTATYPEIPFVIEFTGPASSGG